MTIRRTTLVLLGALTFGCNPDTDQPTIQPGEEITCNNDVFALSLAPEDGATEWPSWAMGPTKLKANIRPLKPTSPDDVTSTTPPYEVKVNAPVAGENEKTAPPPQVMPLDTEGKHWAMGPLTLSSGWIWKIVFNVEDADGNADECVVHIDAT